MNKQAKLLITFCVIGVALASCGNRNETQNLSFLQEPCSAPCWQDIVPGQTQEDEALLTLQDTSSIEIYAQESTSIFWRSTSSTFPGNPIGSIEFGEEDNVVESITIYFDRVGNSGIMVSIDDLIETYGFPKIQLRGRRLNILQVSCELYVYYPELGLSIIGTFECRGSDSIPSTMLVHTVEYFSPDAFYDISNLFPECEVSWDGYREASYYCQCTDLPTEFMLNANMCPP